MDLAKTVFQVEEELRKREAYVVSKEAELKSKIETVEAVVADQAKRESGLLAKKTELDALASEVLNEQKKDQRIRELQELETKTALKEKELNEKSDKLSLLTTELAEKEKRVQIEDTRVFKREKEYKAKLEEEFWKNVKGLLPK